MAYPLNPFFNYSPETKVLSVSSFPEEAWTTIHGGETDQSDMAQLYRRVAWLFRGVDLRIKGVSGMPFAIYKGKREIDRSDDYQNKVGWLKHPRRLFGQAEAALTIWGNGYFERRANLLGGVWGLEYLLPSSIRPKINSDTGEIKFERTVNGRKKTLTPAEIVYLWAFDPFVEIGPALSSPAIAAASAAGVTLSVDDFAAAFFQRGAIKATLLLTEGRVIESEREKLKAWWQRLFQKGSKSAWQTDIVNGDKLTPVQVGEGLESLENRELAEEKRMQIATALGVPHSILFSNAANYATSDQDDQNFAEDTIIPECEFIAEQLNEQVFEPEGYRLEFTPENLPIFQEDEASRGAALAQLTAALEDPEKFLIASAILGYEIPPDALAMIQALQARKEQEREKIAAQLQGSDPVSAETPDEPVEDEPADPAVAARSVDLDRWRRKAIKAIKAGKSAVVKFESEVINPALTAAIGGALEDAQTPEAVQAVFADLWMGYP